VLRSRRPHAQRLSPRLQKLPSPTTATNPNHQPRHQQLEAKVQDKLHKKGNNRTAADVSRLLDAVVQAYP
jgi:hypothetical protein